MLMRIFIVLPIAVAAAACQEPAPINPFQGFQERAGHFAFTQKPAVQRQGNAWHITFACQEACDVTVAVLDKDGRIVRHLASGVLGKNAPHPFQQDTLAQTIAWDGNDDQGRKAPGGCRVKVGLGLKAAFERNIGYEASHVPSGTGGSQKLKGKEGLFLVGKGPDGTYVLGLPDRGGFAGRVFDAQGKYVRTFWPPTAKDVGKLAQHGYKFATTTWGEKILVCPRYGPAEFHGDPRKLSLEEIGKVMFELSGVKEYALGAWPSEIQVAKHGWPVDSYFGGNYMRMTADRTREEIYVGWNTMGLVRLDGQSGASDPTWFPNGEFTRASELCMGPDGLLYARVGTFGYGQWIVRVDHDGKPVDFGGDAVPFPIEGKWHDTGEKIYGGYPRPKAFGKVDVKALWTGLRNHSNVHERGLYVSPKGMIVAAVCHKGSDHAWEEKHGVPPEPEGGSYVRVWSPDGKLLTANAVGDMSNGHGVTMDGDGNIYAAMGGRVPEGQTTYLGIEGVGLSQSTWGSYGSLLKFRGGLAYPAGAAQYDKSVSGEAVKLFGYRSGPTGISGALWIYGGLVCQTPDICSCHNIRYDMDYFARHWIPANHLYAVNVLDANGNLMARLGRYGNVDDSDEDVKTGRDGLRFVWPRALCVSDTALYVTDTGSKRILKAALAYAVEVTVPVP